MFCTDAGDVHHCRKNFAQIAQLGAGTQLKR